MVMAADKLEHDALCVAGIFTDFGFILFDDGCRVCLDVLVVGQQNHIFGIIEDMSEIMFIQSFQFTEMSASHLFKCLLWC